MKQGKKISGGRYRKRRKKKLYELAGQRREVKLGQEKRKIKKVRGRNSKIFLIKANKINVRIGNKISKLEIKNVLETPSNRFLARQNVLSKGTIVQTDKGRVKITNRPSQEGMINGILLE